MSYIDPDTGIITDSNTNNPYGANTGVGWNIEQINKEKKELEKKKQTKFIIIGLAIATGLFFIFKKKRK